MSTTPSAGIINQSPAAPQPSWRKRMEALNITLPASANPIGVYVPAVRSGNLVHTSGQLPPADGVIEERNRRGRARRRSRLISGEACLTPLALFARLGYAPAASGEESPA
ncbi:hypothetical protein [Streptomyces sp. NPDC048644]|uniref:hypothetical protein n=1 Tax=Streptomyces sp. NPDC048644 TaxID=3365582 RepID=UPI003714BBEB